MDHRLEPTLEAVESTKKRDWIWGSYANRYGVRGTWIMIPFGGQFHKISVHNCRRLPEPDELAELIKGVKQLDPDRTWIYENRSGVPGFSATARSNAPFEGSASRAVMITRSHEFTA